MKKIVSGIILAGVILVSSSISFAQSVAPGEDVQTVNFTDISQHWSKEAVQGLAKLGAVPFSTDKFLPQKAITRSEFAVMLRDALGIKINYFAAPDIKDYFDDVSQDAAYAQALVDLVTLNVLEKNGDFNPEAALSREEMVHYVMLAYKQLMGDKYAMIKINPATFKDSGQIKPEYSGEVARAQHYKLISGTGGNMFSPGENTTRAQAAAVIYKMIGLTAEQNQTVTVTPAVTVNEDSIDMTISIKNNTKKDLIINHNSGQKFDFLLMDAEGTDLYRWSADKDFITALTSTEIEAGKTVDFNETLSGDEFKAIKDKIAYMKAYIIGSSDSFEINKDGYDFALLAERLKLYK